MKFPTEKKSTLCIYTAELGTEKIDCNGIEDKDLHSKAENGINEESELRRELEEARAQVRAQRLRCRQLVAALTSRLRVREAELRRARELHDAQLSRVLRALLALEARLRAEQTHIRRQLQQRDALIRAQNRQIETLRQKDRDASPPPPARAGGLRRASGPSRNKNRHVTFQSETREISPSPEPLSGSFEYQVDMDVCAKLRLDRNFRDREEEPMNRDLYKDYQHNPVLECVNQILLQDQEDGETSDYMSLPDDINKADEGDEDDDDDDDDNDDEESKTDDEEETECSSTTGEMDILTYDKPETSNEQQHSVIEHEDDCLDETKSPSVGERLTVPQHSEESLRCEQKKWVCKEKSHSPTMKAEPLEEKACLLMATQGLTLVGNIELEDVDKKEDDNKMKPTYLKSNHSNIPSMRSQIPPAIPPKPPQLGSNFLLRQKRKVNGTPYKQPPYPVHLHHPNGHVHHHEPRIIQITEPPEISFSSPEHDKQHPEGHHHFTIPRFQDKPRQRQILSNGSLKVALNNDNIHEARPQIIMNGPDQKDKNHQKSFEEKIDEFNFSSYQPCQVKGVGPVAARIQRQHLQGNGHDHKPSFLKEENAPSKKVVPIGTTIKVGSSVSSLITGSTGGSIVNELTEGESKSTDESNDGDEEGNDTLRRNFEEFRLEDVDMEEGRPAGDGAETRVLQPVNTSGAYEHFLEATGLSQKSILTPSRMLSNHRSVLKPKDVKHRSRVLKAANERCGAPGTGPVVKYWVEPFL